ncbi:MAG TPA: hypothetical protein DCY13_05075, partial [Verrucomicrobiales bacterium]|nr:hypothetical protein [Verrucomicrobiales bacterium]
HARVKLNSRDLGLYVLKEGYDKGFLKRNFSNPDGNLYDGGFLMDVDQRLDRDEGPGQANWNDLDMLVGAAFESDLDARLRRLTAILDLDRFLSFAALEMLTCDWDGYLQNSNNYRLYHDPEQERFVFIPHGMDQMFWDLNFPITPGPAPMRGRRGGWRRGGLVAARAFEIPELQQRYLARVGQLLETEFTPARLETILHQVEARVTTTYGESEPKVATYLLGQTRHMRRHVGERMRIAAMQYREFAHLVRPGDR